MKSTDKHKNLRHTEAQKFTLQQKHYTQL